MPNQDVGIICILPGKVVKRLDLTTSLKKPILKGKVLGSKARCVKDATLDIRSLRVCSTRGTSSDNNHFQTTTFLEFAIMRFFGSLISVAALVVPR